MFNKDIEKLFQEKFKDFEQQPNEHLWSKIHKELSHKVRPWYLQYKIHGIAIAFVFVLGLLYLNHNKKIFVKGNFKTVITETNNSIDGIIKSNKAAVKNSVVLNKNILEEDVEFNISIGNTKQVLVVQQDEDKKSNSVNKFVGKNRSYNGKSKQIISSNGMSKGVVIKRGNNYKSYSILNKHSSILNIQGKIKDGKTNNSNVLVMKPVVLNSKINKLSLVDLSSVKVNIKNKLNVNDNKNSFNKWEVRSVFIPVYYASFIKNSLFNEFVSNNSKTDVSSSAYGVDVAYSFSNKWSVKTGVFKKNLSYLTKDVEVVFQESISNNLDSQDVGLYSLNDGMFSENFMLSGEVRQDVSYFEMPIEVGYNLINKKIGVNLNGGFSTLFLGENNTAFQGDAKSYSLDADSKLKNVSYSLNVGVDTDIKISNSWKYSVSSSFKYHLNSAISGSKESFNPYSFGLKTGFSYSF